MAQQFCTAVWDYGCDGEGEFYLCGPQSDSPPPEEEHANCLYLKVGPSPPGHPPGLPPPPPFPSPLQPPPRQPPFPPFFDAQPLITWLCLGGGLILFIVCAIRRLREQLGIWTRRRSMPYGSAMAIPPALAARARTVASAQPGE